ncbi:MAG: hypothetical protein WBB68_00205 [Candidatus Moraniibacteriota bacterium]
MEARKPSIKKGIRLGAFVLLGLAFTVVVTHDTWSVFTSEAKSGGNTLHGGSIDLATEDTLTNPTGDTALPSGGSVNFGGLVKNQGTSALLYRSTVSATGDAALCDALQLSALRDGSTKYAGNVAGFGFVDGSLLSAGETEPWLFIVSLPTDTVLAAGLSCSLHFPFTAWQAPYPAPGIGWNDADTFSDLTLVSTGAAAPIQAPEIDAITGGSDTAVPLLPEAIPEIAPEIAPEIPSTPSDAAVVIPPPTDPVTVPEVPNIASTPSEGAPISPEAQGSGVAPDAVTTPPAPTPTE